MAEKIKPKHQIFIAEYILHQDARKAAIKAGYSDKTAGTQGRWILQKASVRAEVDRRLKEIADHHGITAQYIVGALREVADRCMQAVQVLDKEGNPTGEWKFDSGGANRALELLGKYRQLFVEKTEHSLTITLENLVAGSLAPDPTRPMPDKAKAVDADAKPVEKQGKPVITGSALKHASNLKGKLAARRSPTVGGNDNFLLSEVKPTDKLKAGTLDTEGKTWPYS